MSTQEQLSYHEKGKRKKTAFSVHLFLPFFSHYPVSYPRNWRIKQAKHCSKAFKITAQTNTETAGAGTMDTGGSESSHANRTASFFVHFFIPSPEREDHVPLGNNRLWRTLWQWLLPKKKKKMMIMIIEQLASLHIFTREENSAANLADWSRHSRLVAALKEYAS